MSQIDHLVLIPPHLEEFLVEQESETIAEALKQNGTRFQDEELPSERDESTAMRKPPRTSFDLIVSIAVGGDHDDRNVRSCRPRFGQEFKSAHPRHVDVRYDQDK